MNENWEDFRNKIIGLGENSFKKSYYPELQKKLDELENKNKNFETIFESTKDAIIIANESFIIVEFNKKATELFGIEIQEKNFLNELFSIKNEFNIEDIFNQLKIKQELTIEWIAKSVDSKKEFPVQTSLSLSKWDGKSAIVAIIRDFSDYKNFQSQLIAAKEKAEESDKLKTAFLQNISHEIRTPMNAIIGFSQLLNSPQITEEKKKSFVSIIINSSNQLLSIIDDIISISAIETNQMKVNIEKVCVNNLIIDLFTIFKPQTNTRKISLFTKQQLSDKQSEIYTDKIKLVQILTNLLSNALKFTNEGHIEYGYSLKEDKLEFYVKDTGIGIPLNIQEIIFERFRQADISTNRSYGGTGLGLSISKGYVELLGGKIWVESEPNKGSKFFFTIPYKIANQDEKNKTEKKEILILVAEDEEFNFLYIEEILKDLNVKLIHAKDGQDAIEKFEKNIDIELILMDIKMPKIDGYQAAKIIKKQNKNITIIALTAYALENEIERFKDIFDNYFTKPINEKDLKKYLIKYIQQIT